MNLPWLASFALFLAATLGLQSADLNLQPGHIDGQFQAPFFPSTGSAQALQWDSEGRLWVGGSFGGYASHAFNPYPILTRLTAAGNLDSSFRGLGYTADSPLILDRIYSGVKGLLPDSEGRFLACGKLPSEPGQTDSLILFRLLSDGSLDPSFKGVRSSGGAMAMIRTGTGHILLGGIFNECNGAPHTNLVRVFADGTIDSTFHLNLPAEAGSSAGRVNTFARDEEGRIYISGFFVAGDPADPDTSGLIRLDSNFQLDRSFKSPFRGGPESVCVLRNGRLLVGASYKMNPGGFTNRFFRLHADGRWDRSFDPVAERIRGPVQEITLDPSGRPWVVGTDIYRLSIDGDWDPTFVPESAFSLGSSLSALTFNSLGDAFVSGGAWTGTTYDGIHYSSILRIKGGVETPGLGSNVPINYQRPLTLLHQGENLRLAASSSVEGIRSWQWYQHDRPLFRQTNSQLLIPDITTNQSGWYRAVAERVDGSRLVGDAVRLIVYPDSQLGSALNTTGRVWITTGTPWTESKASPNSGPTCARSDEYRPSTASWIQTRVFGPGTVRFVQRGELPGYTRMLEFQANNIGAPLMVGSYPWTQRSVTIPAGWHTLRWMSSPQRDYWVPMTNDEGLFVDSVSFTAALSSRPNIVAQSQVAEVEPGGAVDLFVFVDADPLLKYVWHRDGLPIEGADRQVLRIRDFDAASVADYRVVVSDRAGHTASASFPLRLGRPTSIQLEVLPSPENGSWMVQFTSEPGGTYELQRSLDLVNWTPFRDWFAEDYRLQFELPIDRDAGQGFYRVRLRAL
ncbi:MAG: hypothetical protein JNN07_19880 [Verrucomicrobiales bacterium]|nr:hypothetical protein [Verrucomicrobiales bacterium]